MSNNTINKTLTLTFLLIILFPACAPQPPLTSPGHLNTKEVAVPKVDIPPLVQQTPYVPPPQPMTPTETYAVSVVEVPVKELLFALARDAKMDIDIHANLTGTVTLNAINKTLPQIMERIAEQTGLRYQIENKRLIITPDIPYLHLYRINYVNMTRDSSSEVKISTQIASTGSAEIGQGASGQTSGNDSNTQITNKSMNKFWETLEKNLTTLLAETGGQNNVIINPESGLISVRATYKQHAEIQKFLDQVTTRAQRQVLIEATVTEVTLTDRYQAGIDWRRIAGDYSYVQTLMGGNLGTPPAYSIEYNNPDSKFGDITAIVRLLEQFGTVKVLSSPKIMALNNQTSILKVVDNIVYFTTEVQIRESDSRTTETLTTRYQTEINTLPVGLVMTVTPQISEYDEIILNIRPTISRIIGYKNDPNPDLVGAGIINPIPEIQIREIESLLKINNGNIAIIGGLMQDETNQNRLGVPILSTLPLIGDLFNYRDDTYKKTELVIFLRPVIIKNAGVTDDLQDYQKYLPPH